MNAYEEINNIMNNEEYRKEVFLEFFTRGMTPECKEFVESVLNEGLEEVE